MKAAAPDIRRAAGEVKHSPQEKSETLFSHWHTDSNSPACQSILIKLPPFFKQPVLKKKTQKNSKNWNDTSLRDC